jgi:hypothetical protein
MYICADELGAFIHTHDKEMTDGLSAFYDPTPYQQSRRGGGDGNGLKIRIQSPQLNILCGTTPQNLTDLMPEKAWGQGFTSRLIMIFADERSIGDDFEACEQTWSDNLKHDMTIINGLVGGFHITPEYRTAVMNWKNLGEPPVPAHPKLVHYITRRRTHLYKLSMIAAIDAGNSLVLTKNEFNRAMSWLIEAEERMPEIFKAGTTNADSQAMEEILHFIGACDRGKGVSEQRIRHFARDKVPLYSILRIVDILEQSGQIHMTGKDRSTGIRYFQVATQNDLLD